MNNQLNKKVLIYSYTLCLDFINKYIKVVLLQ